MCLRCGPEGWDAEEWLGRKISPCKYERGLHLATRWGLFRLEDV